MPEIKFLLEKLRKSWLKQSLLVGMLMIFIFIHIYNFPVLLWIYYEVDCAEMFASQLN